MKLIIALVFSFMSSVAWGDTIIYNHPRIFLRQESSNAKIMDLTKLQGRTRGTHLTEYQSLLQSTGPGQALIALLEQDTAALAKAKDFLAGFTDPTPSEYVHYLLTFDWIYSMLSPEEISEYGEIFYQYAVRFQDHLLSIYSHTTLNALMVLGMTALTIMEDKAETESFLQVIAPYVSDFREMVGDTAENPSGQEGHAGFGGGWPEGYYFDRQATQAMLLLFLAYRSASDIDYLKDSRYFRDKIKYLWYGTLPNANYLLPIDTTSQPLTTDEDRLILMILSNEYNDSTAQYWISTIKPAFADINKGFSQLLFYDKGISSTFSEFLPTSTRFEGIGLAILRTGFGPQDTLVAVQSGSYFSQNQHLAQNSIVIYNNVPLLIETGVYRDKLEDHLVNYKMRTISHNSATIYDPDEIFTGPLGIRLDNDGGQWIQQWKGDPVNVSTFQRQAAEKRRRAGEIIDMVSDAKYDYVALRATEAYSADKLSEFIRQVVFIKPNWVILFDKITGPRADLPKRIHFNFLEKPLIEGNTATSIVRRDNEQLFGTTADGKISLLSLLPAQPNFYLAGGQDGLYHYYGSANHNNILGENYQINGGYRFDIEDSGNELSYFLTVAHITGNPEDLLPKVIMTEDSESDVIIQIDNGNYTIGFAKAPFTEFLFSSERQTEGQDLDEDKHMATFFGGDDCNDMDPTVFPGAEEICDGKDNNCDGNIDEGVPNCCTPGTSEPCGSDIGECRQGKRTCAENGAWSVCIGGILPVPEICDGKDNDCNGKIDDGCVYEEIPADRFGFQGASCFSSLILIEPSLILFFLFICGILGTALNRKRKSKGNQRI